MADNNLLLCKRLSLQDTIIFKSYINLGNISGNLSKSLKGLSFTRDTASNTVASKACCIIKDKRKEKDN